MPIDDRPFRPADRGLTRKEIRSMERRAEIRRVVPGVYVNACVPDSLKLRADALSLVVTASAVVHRRSAAWLHGVDAMPLNVTADSFPVELATADGGAAIRRPGVSGSESVIALEDVLSLDGLRVTSPLRTAIDLGLALAAGQALAVLDTMTARGMITPDALRAATAVPYRRRGVTRLRELIEWIEPASESVMESWSRCRAMLAGFPRPVVQHWVHDDNGRPIYRLDMAWPERMVALEYDGEAYHGPEQAAADAARRAWLRARGWTVLVVRRGEVLGRSHEFELALGEALGMTPRLGKSA
jgi:hypothetical protein